MVFNRSSKIIENCGVKQSLVAVGMKLLQWGFNVKQHLTIKKAKDKLDLQFSASSNVKPEV